MAAAASCQISARERDRVRLLNVEARHSFQAHLPDGFLLQRRRGLGEAPASRQVVRPLHELGGRPPQLAQVGVVETKPRLKEVAKKHTRQKKRRRWDD